MSQTNPGFDVRSVADDDIRIIEVKAVDGPWNETGVGMTQTEFGIAREKGEDYWLYVVENARGLPTVHPIRNPAGRVDRFMFDHGWRDAADPPEPAEDDEFGPPSG
jgi:hypothetical protein